MMYGQLLDNPESLVLSKFTSSGTGRPRWEEDKPVKFPTIPVFTSKHRLRLDQQPLPEEDETMALVTIKRYRDLSEAIVARSFLESAGIPALCSLSISFLCLSRQGLKAGHVEIVATDGNDRVRMA
jgi:hypothetical protein